MLKHGLKFLQLSKITTHLCQHCSGIQLVSELSEKTCFEVVGVLHQSGTLGLAYLSYNVGWPQPHLSPALLQPSVPSIAALPPFKNKEALEMRRDSVEVDGKEAGGRNRGALAQRSDSRHWMLIGTIICIHLCHPGLSVGTFRNCFCNSRLAFLREKKLPSGLRIKVWLL